MDTPFGVATDESRRIARVFRTDDAYYERQNYHSAWSTKEASTTPFPTASTSPWEHFMLVQSPEGFVSSLNKKAGMPYAGEDLSIPTFGNITDDQERAVAIDKFLADYNGGAYEYKMEDFLFIPYEQGSYKGYLAIPNYTPKPPTPAPVEGGEVDGTTDEAYQDLLREYEAAVATFQDLQQQYRNYIGRGYLTTDAETDDKVSTDAAIDQLIANYTGRGFLTEDVEQEGLTAQKPLPTLAELTPSPADIEKAARATAGWNNGIASDALSSAAAISARQLSDVQQAALYDYYDTRDSNGREAIEKSLKIIDAYTNAVGSFWTGAYSALEDDRLKAKRQQFEDKISYALNTRNSLEDRWQAVKDAVSLNIQANNPFSQIRQDAYKRLEAKAPQIPVGIPSWGEWADIIPDSAKRSLNSVLGWDMPLEDTPGYQVAKIRLTDLIENIGDPINYIPGVGLSVKGAGALTKLETQAFTKAIKGTLDSMAISMGKSTAKGFRELVEKRILTRTKELLQGVYTGGLSKRAELTAKEIDDIVGKAVTEMAERMEQTAVTNALKGGTKITDKSLREAFQQGLKDAINDVPLKNPDFYMMNVSYKIGHTVDTRVKTRLMEFLDTLPGVTKRYNNGVGGYLTDIEPSVTLIFDPTKVSEAQVTSFAEQAAKIAGQQSASVVIPDIKGTDFIYAIRNSSVDAPTVGKTLMAETLGGVKKTASEGMTAIPSTGTTFLYEWGKEFVDLEGALANLKSSSNWATIKGRVKFVDGFGESNAFAKHLANTDISRGMWMDETSIFASADINNSWKKPHIVVAPSTRGQGMFKTTISYNTTEMGKDLGLSKIINDPASTKAQVASAETKLMHSSRLNAVQSLWDYYRKLDVSATEMTLSDTWAAAIYDATNVGTDPSVAVNLIKAKYSAAEAKSIINDLTAWGIIDTKGNPIFSVIENLDTPLVKAGQSGVKGSVVNALHQGRREAARIAAGSWVDKTKDAITATQEAVFDKLQRINDATGAAKKQWAKTHPGQAYPIEADAELWAALLPGSGSKALVQTSELSKTLKGILKKAGVKPSTLQDTMYFKHAIEVATAHPDDVFTIGGKTLNITDLRKGLDETLVNLTPKQRQGIDDALAEIRKTFDGYMDEFQQAGFFDKAKADELKARYPTYWQMVYAQDEFNLLTRRISSHGVKEVGTLKTVHDLAKMLDPLGSISHSITSKEYLLARQKMMSAIGKMVEINPTIQAQLVDPSVAKGSITYWENGARVTKDIPAKLAKELDWYLYTNQTWFERMVRNLNDLSRVGMTTLNVAFGFHQFGSDALNVFLSAGVKPHELLKSLLATIKNTVVDDPVITQMLKAGAGQGGKGVAGLSGEFLRSSITKGGGILFDEPMWKRLIAAPFKVLDNVTYVSETAPRRAAFQRAIKQGMTPEQAALVARRATIDFNRSGWAVAHANNLYLFLNAGIQGTALPFRTLAKDPSAALRVGAIVGSQLTTYAWNRQFPEYWDVKDEIRRGTFIIMLPSVNYDTNGRPIPRYIAISPKREMAMFTEPITYLLERMEKDSKGNRLVSDEWRDFMAEWLPIINPLDQYLGSNTSWIPGQIPSTLYALWKNEDSFRKSPIVPDSLKDLPATQQYTDYTSEAAVRIGQALGISPIQVEYLIDNIGGGLGSQILGIFDYGIWKSSKDPDDKYKVWLTKLDSIQMDTVDPKQIPVLRQEFLDSLSPAERETLLSLERQNRNEPGIPILGAIFNKYYRDWGGGQIVEDAKRDALREKIAAEGSSARPDSTTTFHTNMTDAASAFLAGISANSPYTGTDYQDAIANFRRQYSGALYEYYYQRELSGYISAYDYQDGLPDEYKMPAEFMAMNSYNKKEADLMSQYNGALNDAAWAHINKELDLFLKTFSMSDQQYILEHKDDWIKDLPEVPRKIETKRLADLTFIRSTGYWSDDNAAIWGEMRATDPSLKDASVSTLRTLMRQRDPKLDATLNFWGYTTSIQTLDAYKLTADMASAIGRNTIGIEGLSKFNMEEYYAKTSKDAAIKLIQNTGYWKEESDAFWQELEQQYPETLGMNISEKKLYMRQQSPELDAQLALYNYTTTVQTVTAAELLAKWSSEKGLTGDKLPKALQNYNPAEFKLKGVAEEANKVIYDLGYWNPQSSAYTALRKMYPELKDVTDDKLLKQALRESNPALDASLAYLGHVSYVLSEEAYLILKRIASKANKADIAALKRATKWYNPKPIILKGE